MDPLSKASAIPPLLIACRNSVIALKGLSEQYKNVRKTIEWLCAQSNSIMTALAQIQQMCLDPTSVLARQCIEQPSILKTIDENLIVCASIFSSLYKSLRKIRRDSAVIFQPGFWIKIKVMWYEDEMKEYSQRMKGLALSLSVLIQTMQL